MWRRAMIVIAVAVSLLMFASPANAGPYEDSSWYVDEVRLSEAHALSRGNGTVVGVVDTGVDKDNPQLSGRVLPGATVTDNGVKIDGAHDTDGHGTAMAGLIAGAHSVENPLVGVAPGAEILPVRIEPDADGVLDHKLVYEGVRWAIDHGARVVNLSLAGHPTASSKWKSELLSYAIKHDTLIVAAVGNKDDGYDEVGEPAAIPGVIAVSGLARDGGLWSGSVMGDSVVLCAPAQDLPHIHRDGEVGPESGTSAAAALVSGVAALVVSRYSDATVSDVAGRLIDTAVDRGASGRDSHFGYGSIDAYAALTENVDTGGRYPLDLPASVRATPHSSPSQTWWLALPLGLSVMGGGGVVVWLVRRLRWAAHRALPCLSTAPAGVVTCVPVKVDQFPITRRPSVFG